MRREVSCQEVVDGSCELGGLGHVTDVTAGQLDHVPTEPLPQFHGCLVAWITARLLPGRRHDAVGTRFERVEIEGDRRVLAQLVLEPLGGVGTNILVVLGAPRAGHDLPVRLWERALAERL